MIDKNASAYAHTHSRIIYQDKELYLQVSIKRFLKINLAHVGMAQCMNALADKYKNKKCHAHSDIHSITWPHYSTTILT